MQLLWQLGRHDGRELGPNPSHAIRVLCELGNYDGRKPVSYCEALLQFGLGLVNDESNWGGHYTPLDILKPLLSVEGTNNFSNGRTLTLTPYFINYEVVRPLRAAVIDKILDLLTCAKVGIARAAGSFLGSAVQYPHGLFGSAPPKELGAELLEEFASTLKRVQNTIHQGVNPLVALAIARSVSWHANYGSGKPAVLARDVLDDLPDDPGFLLLAALTDSWGELFIERKDTDCWQSDLDNWLLDVASSVRAAKPGASEGLSYLEQTLIMLNEAGESQSSARAIINKLVEDDDFAHALIEDALSRTTSLTRNYASVALGQFMRRHKEKGRAYARRFLESGDRDLSIAAAQAYCGSEIENEDEKLIKLLLSSSDASTVSQAIHAVWLWRTNDDAKVIELLLGANLARNARLVDQIAMAFCGGHARLVNTITENEAARLFQHLAPMEEIEGYWVDNLLTEFSCRFPYLTATFFMDRVEIAAQRQSYRFRPANFGPYCHKRLRFLESRESLGVLNLVWRWLRQNQGRDHYFQYAATHVFEAMFLDSSEMLVDFFRPMLPTAMEDDLKLMGCLLREADSEFVFTHAGFVVDLLDRCHAVDFDLHQEIWHQLYAAAVSGLRTGAAGEPASRDLSDKKKAEDVLERNPV